MDGRIADEQMRNAEILITGISSLSGGGKTAVAMRVSELLPDTVTIFFDDYDFDTVHPASFRRWLKEGANYNDWKCPKLKDDLTRLKAGQEIVSPVDGLTINPRKYVIFDSPFGYAHTETGGLIDLMVFIDTPLDVAMARRLLRDFSPASVDNSSTNIGRLTAELIAYLDYGRQAYLEMDKQIKPICDLLLDGCSAVDDLAKVVVRAIRTRTAESLSCENARNGPPPR